MVLNDAKMCQMIQTLDLSNNSGIEDADLVALTDAFISLEKKGNLSSLKHLYLGYLGVSPTALSTFIKSMPRIAKFKTLDLSGNAIPFFCADALVTCLKSI